MSREWSPAQLALIDQLHKASVPAQDAVLRAARLAYLHEDKDKAATFAVLVRAVEDVGAHRAGLVVLVGMLAAYAVELEAAIVHDDLKGQVA